METQMEKKLEHEMDTLGYNIGVEYSSFER